MTVVAENPAAFKAREDEKAAKAAAGPNTEEMSPDEFLLYWLENGQDQEDGQE